MKRDAITGDLYSFEDLWDDYGIYIILLAAIITLAVIAYFKYVIGAFNY